MRRPLIRQLVIAVAVSAICLMHPSVQGESYAQQEPAIWEVHPSYNFILGRGGDDTSPYTKTEVETLEILTSTIDSFFVRVFESLGDQPVSEMKQVPEEHLDEIGRYLIVTFWSDVSIARDQFPPCFLESMDAVADRFIEAAERSMRSGISDNEEFRLTAKLTEEAFNTIEFAQERSLQPEFPDLESFKSLTGVEQSEIRQRMTEMIRTMGQFSAVGLVFTKGVELCEQEILVQQAEYILEPTDPMQVQVRRYLADAYSQSGQFEKAIEIRREMLSRRAANFGAESDEYASALGGLAFTLSDAGQFDEADEIISDLEINFPDLRNFDALLIRHYVTARLPEKAAPYLFSEDSMLVIDGGCGGATHFRNLYFLQTGKWPEALSASARHLQDCLSWFNKGFQDLTTAEALGDFGEAMFHIVHSDYFDREPSFALADVHAEMAALLDAFAEAENFMNAEFGPSHPTLMRIQALEALLRLYLGEKDALSDLESVIDRSIQRFGANHPFVVDTLEKLTSMDMAEQPPGTKGAFRAIPISLGQTAAEFGEEPLARNPDGLANRISGLVRQSVSLARAVPSLQRQEVLTEDEAEASIAAAFILVQSLSSSSAADALQASTARLGADDPDLATLLDARTSAERDLAATRALLVTLRSIAGGDAETEASVEARVNDALRRLKAANEEIDERFPEIGALISRRATSLRDAQSVLERGEALIVFSFAAEADELSAFVVTAESAHFVPLETDLETVSGQIEILRAALDVPTDTAALAQQVFDLDVGVELYDDVFAPLRPYLDGVKRSIIVSDGELETLPLHVLPVSRPDGWTGRFEDYRDTKWLADEFAFSRLPAVSSLVTLRRVGQAGVIGKRSLLGFADPVLGDDVTVEGQMRPDPGHADILLNLSGDGALTLSALPRVPQTRDLLEQLGSTMDASLSDLFFAEDAEEARLHALNEAGDLKKFRNIAFATHALIDGAEAGVDDLLEPALVLTPPKNDERRFNNDGLLRASEVIGLSLQAEFVILAACNTAAPDGSTGAEALSGLVKAFFFAGARSVLVSNWPAEANATAILAPQMASRIEQDGMDRSDALKAAMIHLRHEEADYFAHPALWAPFMVVSDR